MQFLCEVPDQLLNNEHININNLYLPRITAYPSYANLIIYSTSRVSHSHVTYLCALLPPSLCRIPYAISLELLPNRVYCHDDNTQPRWLSTCLQ